MFGSVFNKNLTRSCEYCVHGHKLPFSGDVICRKHGLADKNCCRDYKYDPLKRVPKKPKIADNYKPEDFKL